MVEAVLDRHGVVQVVAGFRQVADVRPGAAWRSELGIVEPSQQLVEAIESLDEMVQSAAQSADTPTFDAVLATAREDRPGEEPLDELVRAVLRSTSAENERAGSIAPREPER